MFRFYKTVVVQMLFALVWLRENGFDLPRINTYVTENARGFRGEDESLNLLIYNLSRKEGYGSMINMGSMIEVIGALKDQISEGGKPSKDKDLIDTIVRTLQLPNCGNVLSGRTLERLRQAILLPDEMAGLIDRLARQEWSCSACGHQFQDGEMGTIQRPVLQGNNMRTQLVCSNCALPTFVACSNGCKNSMEIGKKLFGRLRSYKCKECAGGKVEPGIAEVAAEVGVRVDPNLWGVRRQPPPLDEPPQIGVPRAVLNDGQEWIRNLGNADRVVQQFWENPPAPLGEPVPAIFEPANDAGAPAIDPIDQNRGGEVDVIPEPRGARPIARAGQWIVREGRLVRR